MAKTLDSETEFDVSNCGIFVLISDLDLDKNEVVPRYYTRQSVEKLFGIAKEDLNILPLRVHNEQTFRGFIMLIFITLIYYLCLKNQLKSEKTHPTVEEALTTMRNQKCKVFDSSVLPCEMNKKQRLLMLNTVGI